MLPGIGNVQPATRLPHHTRDQRQRIRYRLRPVRQLLHGAAGHGSCGSGPLLHWRSLAVYFHCDTRRRGQQHDLDGLRGFTLQIHVALYRLEALTLYGKMVLAGTEDG